jgi:hypothetical protein
MKSTIDLLSQKDREALASFHGSDAFNALKKLHDATVIGLGKDALIAQTLEEVKFLNGRAYQSKVILSLIKEIHKLVDKEG